MSTAVDTDKATALATAANEARGLAMDSIAAAHSGHMGLPLGAAEIGAVLWGSQVRSKALLRVMADPGKRPMRLVLGICAEAMTSVYYTRSLKLDQELTQKFLFCVCSFSASRRSCECTVVVLQRQGSSMAQSRSFRPFGWSWFYVRLLVAQLGRIRLAS
jgi:hypothetical protein